VLGKNNKRGYQWALQKPTKTILAELRINKKVRRHSH
jgi:hypothetical protein